MRRKNSYGSMMVMLFFIAIIGAVVYIYNAPMFERNAPVITLKNNGYWNLKEPLPVVIEDESGMKSYRVTLIDGDKRVILAEDRPLAPQQRIELEIEPPVKVKAMRTEKVVIRVEATDVSSWNFFAGNDALVDAPLDIDTKRPLLSTISHSYGINRGGSALVIFKADDENIESMEIETNYGKSFKPQPFFKEGYYISLVAWPVMESSFKATLVVTDKAGNTARSRVPYHLKEKNYRVSKIKLSDKFLNGKIAELGEAFAEAHGVENRLEQFKIINEDVRAKNENLIHEITSRTSDTLMSDFGITPFYPLKNGQVVARFGDHRLYYYDNMQVSESYHLGLDLASVKMGEIKTQNPAAVVFAEENGIYGNMPILHHGLGLYTLYGHCSATAVSQGDQMRSGDKVGNTGMSGYAMGDHLHFGVLVQGIEVRPEEWMDKQWIRLNVTDIIRDAKALISRQ